MLTGKNENSTRIVAGGFIVHVSSQNKNSALSLKYMMFTISDTFGSS